MEHFWEHPDDWGHIFLRGVVTDVGSSLDWRAIVRAIFCMSAANNLWGTKRFCVATNNIGGKKDFSDPLEESMVEDGL